MPRKKLIPDEIREQVIAIVEQFNEENALPPEADSTSQILQILGISSFSQTENRRRTGEYVPRFRGAYLYLNRIGYNKRPLQICRLKWTGSMDKWEFAIYKHSKNHYDPDEWMFPGSGEMDGTVAGAMKAGNQAYPIY
ncbi:MAG TPA: hypothetical protein EYP41_04680 [Anaerolineae bacterium]|nr:hypothetical protein [Anaerolineae bacterium]